VSATSIAGRTPTGKRGKREFLLFHDRLRDIFEILAGEKQSSTQEGASNLLFLGVVLT